jgi:hypothetical protein
MDDDMASALDELGNMIREQQNLRDKTFRQGQDQRRNQRGPRGQQQPPQQGQQKQQQQQGDQFGNLKQNQQALREQLKKLLEEMKKRGQADQPGQPGPGQDPGEGLGQAEQAMRDAEGALGDSNADGAVDAQGRALEALRRGAQNLAQQMQPGGPGPGPGQPGRTGPARANNDTDPLGRPLRGRDTDDGNPNRCVLNDSPNCLPLRRRAEEILNELRRRYADPARPQIELEYIERLLKDF